MIRRLVFMQILHSVTANHPISRDIRRPGCPVWIAHLFVCAELHKHSQLAVGVIGTGKCMPSLLCQQVLTTPNQKIINIHCKPPEFVVYYLLAFTTLILNNFFKFHSTKNNFCSHFLISLNYGTTR